MPHVRSCSRISSPAPGTVDKLQIFRVLQVKHHGYDEIDCGQARYTGECVVTRHRANKDLHASRFKLRIKADRAVFVTERKYIEKRRSVGGGRGRREWDTLVERGNFESDGVIMNFMDELQNIKMVTSQDPEEYSLRVEQQRSYLITHSNDEYLAHGKMVYRIAAIDSKENMPAASSSEHTGACS